jgi:phosphohistidine phosphatase
VGLLLYLMRHGAAEDISPSGRDADRPLTRVGSAAVRRVALALQAGKLHAPSVPVPGGRPLGQIIASPLVRAQQTADILRGVLCPHVDIETDEDLTPEGSAYDLAVRLASMTCDTLLVGHQPNIEMVARAIIASPVSGVGPAARLPASFRTATVVAFHVEGRPPPYRLALAIDPAALPGD